MKHILEQLKEFKKIEPNTAYVTRSRMDILGAFRNPRKTVWDVFLQTFEYGAAIAFAGFLFLLLFGKFPLLQIFSPRISGLNPGSLRAEAEAIDIQIQLANLNYDEPAAKAVSAPKKKKVPLLETIMPQTSSSPSSTDSIPESDNASSTSIDDALDIISQ